MTSSRRRWPTALAAVLATVALGAGATACSSGAGSGDHSTSTGSATHTEKIAVTVKGNDITPNAEPVTISVGQPVELDVTADRSGELHVHSSPEHEFEFAPGKSTFHFTLDQPGTVIVEEHVSDALVLKILVR